MSNSVGTHRCRTSGERSPRWVTLMMIAAMFSFAGLVFADAGTSSPVTVGGKAAERAMAPNLGSEPSGDNTTQSSSATLAAPPANDTCAGAIALQLNRSTIATTADANNDYQSPNNLTCFSGLGNQATSSPGRDVVFTFTAPHTGKFTFEYATFNPNDTMGGVANNPVLYLVDSCATPGTLSCIRGSSKVNPARGFVAGASNGFGQGNGEGIECVSMTAGQTHTLIFDDRAPGKCSPLDTGGRSSNCYQDSDCGTVGAVCTPLLNPGGRLMIDVRECNSEVEPNDTPAQANPFVCGTIGETSVGPTLHCYLGTRAGQVCRRFSQANAPFLGQDHPDSKNVCSVSGVRCGVDLTLGTSNCPIPGEFCQATVGQDCDPRCDVGPNAGKTCSSQAFCNPGSDQGATCAGTCQAESTCVVDATGVNTGVACTPVCVGSSIPAVNGRYCSAISGCPGGGVCTVTPNPPTAGATCLAGQTCTRGYNEGDTDFYSLGVVPSGSVVFAAINAIISSDSDYRMRVTTDTHTLQFDDDDNPSRMGQSAPVIGGAVANGQATYIEVSKTGPVEGTPYELTANIRPPLAQAQLEDETVSPTGNDNYFLWPGDLLALNPINNGANNGYLRGQFAYNQDSDCFKFLVNEGDMMDWITTANPQRTPGPLTLIDHPQVLIYDAIPAGISNFAWGGNPRKNTNPNVPQAGLKATSPAITSFYLQWRAQYTGLLEVCTFSASQFISQGVPAYPNDWSASFTVNCGPVQSAGPGTTTTDVKVEKVLNSVCSELGCLPYIPGSPVTPGDFVEYLITITNNGTEIAQEVALDETLDPNLTFISLTVDDGFSGNNTLCTSLPTAGTNDAPVSCIIASMTPGQVATYVLTAQVNNCLAPGIQIDNYVVLTQVSTDPNPDNDYSLVSFTTADRPDHSCEDLVCAGGTCFFDLCTTGDTCVAGVCESGGAPDCNDNNVCTDDSCDPQVGCISDSSQNGDNCDDFNVCTINTCNPTNGCEFVPEPPTTPCDDTDTCTNSDHCDGNGSCTGNSVCADGNPCTLDEAAPGTCACSNPPGNDGAECQDGDPCTADDSCLAGGCVSGEPTVCDDLDLCTTDTCNTGFGCAFTPVVCAPPDQCHQPGVCNSGSGSCDYAPVADGTACDDGDSATDNDVCTAGVCAGESACDTQPTPKSEGYYKKLCKNGVPHPHGGDALTDADAVCVGQLTDTFAGITTAAEICSSVYDHDSSNHDSQGPDGKECQKADRELMALALNICRDRVCLSQEVDSRCQGGNQHVLTTVQESLDTVDDILSDPARNKTTCKDGRCLAKEINNGKGLHHTSLLLTREGTSKVRLTWESPVFDDGSGEASKYTIWRRVLNADAVWVKMADTQNLTWVDNNPGTTTWEYEVTFTIDVD